ncbi:MAG: hypothetical protein ABIS67_15805 [Candidatus Eisenbacteria bacterium]
MTQKSKMLAGGLAILLAGAAVGWNASHLSAARSGAAADTTAFDVQENVLGNLTPQMQYQPAPAPGASRSRSRSASGVATVRGVTIPAGTAVAVTVNSELSSKTARVGETWSGTVAEPVYRNGREVVPAGSRVSGVVTMATPAERGDRARLQLAMRSIVIDGRSHTVRGSSEAVVAGSPRLRNAGAIAGGTAAGALLGKVIGHSTKSTVIGAVVGGGAATAAVAGSKGYQATISAGQQLQFTTGSSVTVRA